MSQILVVDDEPAVREVLIEFLADHGYSADGAVGGENALEICSRTPPQVVLLDIAMPGMNGIETLKRLRCLAPACAVIMISGHADHDMALQALDLGAYDFIQKPLDLQYLERTLLAKIVTLEPAAPSVPPQAGPSESSREVQGAGQRPGRRRRG
jgi:DNA-binding NtrC family response regulator